MGWGGAISEGNPGGKHAARAGQMLHPGRPRGAEHSGCWAHLEAAQHGQRAFLIPVALLQAARNRIRGIGLLLQYAGIGLGASGKRWPTVKKLCCGWPLLQASAGARHSG